MTRLQHRSLGGGRRIVSASFARRHNLLVIRKMRKEYRAETVIPLEYSARDSPGATKPHVTGLPTRERPMSFVLSVDTFHGTFSYAPARLICTIELPENRVSERR